VETTAGIVIACDGNGQLCEPRLSREIETTGELRIQYRVAPTHCSSVKLRLFVDGVEKAVTGFLGWYSAPPPFDVLPLETDIIDLGPVTPGKHVLDILPEGQESGCNRGSVGSWSGELRTYTQVLAISGRAEAPVMAGRGRIACRNLTTGKAKTRRFNALSESVPGDCATTGLAVKSGDRVRLNVLWRGRVN
jgi:hypothetical protein